jgi:hypothetical protein
MSLAASPRPWLIAASISSSVLAAPAYADDMFTICIGDRLGCGVTVTATFACGTSPQQAATSICTVPTAKGQVARRFAIKQLSATGGGACGFAQIAITCFDH